MGIAQMSVYGGVLILVTLAVRAVALNRVPKLTLVALWALCVLRLLVPLQMPSGLSVYSALDSAAEQVSVAAGGEDVPAVRAVRGFMGAGAGGAGVEISLGASTSPGLSPWTVLWAVGAVFLALFFLWAYLRSRRRFRLSVPETDPELLAALEGMGLRRRVRLARAPVSSPLTYGLLRPVILLPTDDGGDAGGLVYVLTHELVHIRRFDGLKKLFLMAALCFHWFNPLVWLLYVYANRDIELACDDGVLTLLGRDCRSGYALTLIGYAEVRGPAVFSSFGQHSIEERIRLVMKYKKRTLLGTIGGLALLGVVALCFATGVAASPEPEPDSAPTIERTESAPADWDGELAFSENVVLQAGIPVSDMETIDGLLAASGDVSARELRQQFAGAAELSDTLYPSCNELIGAEYDSADGPDPGLSPAGLVLCTLMDEYYMDIMETPGRYSGGYTYVADSVGELGEDDVPSDYYVGYFVQYELDYTYQDDTAITIREVAGRMAEFSTRLFAYVEPLLTDGMTAEQARASFAAADVAGKMDELLTEINGDGVTFTLGNVEINLNGFGPWEDDEDLVELTETEGHSEHGGVS